MKKFLNFTGWPVFSGVLIAIIILLVDDPLLINRLTQSPQVTQNNTPIPPTKPIFSYSEPIAKASPAVVSIFTTAAPTNSKNIDNGSQSTGEEIVLGSGVIVDQLGHILTNQHVLENARQVIVILNKYTQLKAKIVGVDKTTDLGVLKIDPTITNIHAITSASSEDVNVGDIVFAIGSPFGLGASVSMGIVSATGRYGSLGVDGGKQIPGGVYEGFIQTDAYINPGNSGGALVNAHGNLIGINSFFKSNSNQYQGVGFAIPINLASQVMSEIVQHGKVIRSYMGFSGENLNESHERRLGINNPHGIIVLQVSTNSPADKAGLKPGDIITHINQNFINLFDLIRLQISIRPGETVRLNIIHNGQHKTIDLVAGINPKDLQ